MSNYRSFTVIKVSTTSGHNKGKDNLGGRYISKTSSGAAKKAVTQICRSSKIKGRCVLTVSIRETTKDSKKKTYTYRVKRIYDPTTVMRDGEEITYKYRTEIEAVKDK